MSVRVLVADDMALVRAGFIAILDRQEDIEVAGEAENGAAVLEQVDESKPDVVLMDVRMPVMDGIEATRRLQARPDPPRVLMLTTFDLNEYVYEAMRAGASGFLLKDVPRDELSAAIRTIARGDSLLAPAITRRLIEDFVRRPAPGGGRPAAFEELTDRELEVLTLIARGLSNAEIAGELFLSEATVKTHVTRVLQKLGVRDRVQAVIAAYENGLVAPGSGSGIA
ncbi:MAG: response regulator transcription factor [Solirubrobacterales bacterium]|mgnify:FL=1|nr:response regulator transcription factor [Solirubrobacterales bacterium]OJU94527.1 MAG: DNA-binding response regulator [Solirubrobacterales bacterium 67-14]